IPDAPPPPPALPFPTRWGGSKRRFRSRRWRLLRVSVGGTSITIRISGRRQHPATRRLRGGAALTTRIFPGNENRRRVACCHCRFSFSGIDDGHSRALGHNGGMTAVPERLRPLLAPESPLQDLARRFAAAGHSLHLVGGSVRDALLGVTKPDA